MTLTVSGAVFSLFTVFASLGVWAYVLRSDSRQGDSVWDRAYMLGLTKGILYGMALVWLSVAFGMVVSYAVSYVINTL